MLARLGLEQETRGLKEILRDSRDEFSEGMAQEKERQKQMRLASEEAKRQAPPGIDERSQAEKTEGELEEAFRRYRQELITLDGYAYAVEREFQYLRDLKSDLENYSDPKERVSATYQNDMSDLEEALEAVQWRREWIMREQRPQQDDALG